MRVFAATLALAIGGIATAPASATTPTLSLQGYTGLIAVPTAHVTPHGVLELGYNNDVESAAPAPIDIAENYLFSIGLWERVEVGGRLAMGYSSFDTRRRDGEDSRRFRNDLSGNIKLRLFDIKRFSFAVGAQDFAGDGQRLRARYGVVTAHLPFRSSVTLGYSTGRDRMDGAIAGASVGITRFADLIADYDADEFNYGLRLHHRFRNGIRLTGIVSGTTDRRQSVAAGISLGLPLTLSRSVPRPAPRDTGSAVRVGGNGDNAGRQTPTAEEPDHAADARPAEAPAETTRDRVVVNSSDTPRNSLLAWQEAGLLDAYGHHVPDDRATPAVEYRYGIPIRERTATGEMRWSSSWRRRHHPLEAPVRGELRVEPFLRSIVGSDFGPFDYSLAADISGRAQLPAGLAGYATYSAAIANSGEFSEGGFFAQREHSSRFRESALQWGVHPLPGTLALLTRGRTRIEELDYNFFHAESATHFDGGRHRVRLAYGRYKPLDSLNFRARRTRVAEYRYFWMRPEVLLSLQFGDYFFSETGGKVELTRFFGDVAVHLFYHRDDRSTQVAGFGFSIPLTPSRTPRLGPLVLTGSPGWRYAVNTSVNEERDRNRLRPTFMIEPLPRYSLTADVLDRDRAFPAALQ